MGFTSTSENIKWHKQMIINNFKKAFKFDVDSMAAHKKGLHIDEMIANLCKVIKAYSPTPKEYHRNWRKNTAGYNAFGAKAGLDSKLYTEDALKKGALVVKDHVFGATAVGERIESFIVKGYFHKKNGKLDLKNVEKFIRDNLHLSGVIKVTKEEHHKDNIIRHKHNLKDKNCFKHYKNISKIVRIL